MLPLPIAAPQSDWPMLYLPKKLTEASWQQMLGVLNAMKVGVVEEDEGDAGRDD